MNKKYYLIQDLLSNGFWSEDYLEFKGILFATKYQVYPFAGLIEATSNKKSKCVVLEVYD